MTILLLTLTAILGNGSVFALNTPDSSPWQTGKNYAAIPVRANCSSFGGDSDSDGICDNWEKNSNPGLHVNFTDSTQGTTTVQYRYDLACTPGKTIADDPTGLTVCPSVNKKDVYLELDYMTGQNPDMRAISDVVKAFDKQNIALHIQLGENPLNQTLGDIKLHYCFVNWGVLRNGGTAGQACSTTSTNYQSYPWLKQARFGTVAERSGNATFCPIGNVPTNYQAAGPVSNNSSYNCLTAKRQVFHYGMFVNYQSGGVTNSGIGEINGNDILVSLGNFENNGVGTIDEQEADLMHELGHNFGLGHGGLTSQGVADSNNNCKPNYPSVMSYTYLFRKTADVCRPLDYSTSKLSNLTESALHDSNIGSLQYPVDNPNPPDDPNRSPPCATSGERKIFWSNGANIMSGTTGTTTDWNVNGVNQTQQYSLVLNNMPSQCTYTTYTTLNGTNDWDYIKNGNSANAQPLNFRPSSNFWQRAPSGGGDNEVAPDAHTDNPPTESWVIIPYNNPGSIAYSIGIAIAVIGIIIYALWHFTRKK